MKQIKEGYKMTELGEIPQEWSIKILGDIGEFKNGLNKGKEDFGFGYKFVNIKDAYTGNEVKVDKLELINAEEKEIKMYSLSKGDIVFVRSSLKPEGVGYPILYDSDVEKVLYCGFMIRYRYNPSKYNPKYMLYQLKSCKTRKKVLDFSTVSANTNINQDSLKQIKIVVPLIKEQQKIAYILTTVDEQIELNDSLIKKTKELKKGLMQQLLTQGIGHEKFKDTEIGRIPEEWGICNFFQVINKVIDFRGRTPKKLGMDWGNGYIIALSAFNVKMGKIDFDLETNYASEKLYEKWMSGNEVHKGDIVITMEAPLGNVATIPDDRKYVLSQRVIALKTKKNISNNFFKYLLMSETVQNQLCALSTGSTAKGINQKNLAKVFLFIPSIEEQQKIASILSSVDTQIENYQAKKEKLQELKKSLMQQLLTGKLRVKIEN